MKNDLKNILVPVDFNPSSLQAISYAADLGSTVYHVTLKSPVPAITVKGESKVFGGVVDPVEVLLR